MPLLDPRRARAAGLVSDTADAQHPALVDPTGRLTYGELTDRVTALAAGLPPAGRRLVHVPPTPHRDPVLGYLVVLPAGHVPLVTPPEHRSITAVHPPDLWLRPDGTFRTATPGGAAGGPRHVPHPDLALLLSTSGSTGSPKLVRLSHRNLLSSAEAIAAALSITPADRAVTSLPLHYCFGLPVLHAQLRAGATTVLRPGSVTDPGLADDLRRDRGRAAGWGIAVMYGQTGATARMAVLPPELAQAHPDAVGWPIAGSAFRLEPSGVDGAAGAAHGFFAGQTERNLTIMAGLVVLALVPAPPVPRPLVRPLGALAAASLHIYLVQFQVFAFVDTPVVEFAVAIAAGLGFCAVTNHVLRRLPGGPVVRRRAAAKQLAREDITCVDARF